MVAFDGHEMCQLGSFDGVIETEEKNTVINCNRNFGLAGRDFLCQHILHTSTGCIIDNKYVSLTGIEGALATIVLHIDATPALLA